MNHLAPVDSATANLYIVRDASLPSEIFVSKLLLVNDTIPCNQVFCIVIYRPMQEQLQEQQEVQNIMPRTN